MASFLKKPIQGVIAPLVTPLRDNITLDETGLEALIEHVLAGGVHGVFLLGSSGEAPNLSYPLRRELVERAIRQIGERVPVLVGITDTSFAGSLEMAGTAEKAGAGAVVLAPPYYVAPGQKDLLAYIERLAAELSLPCFLYNMPSLTKVSMSIDTVLRAAEISGIAGIKDSSGDMLYFHRLLDAFAGRPDFPVMMGPEELLGQAVLAGAAGGVSGGSNIHPRLLVDLYEAARADDAARVRELQKSLMRLRNGIYDADEESGYYLKGVKTALAFLGICNDFMAEPFTRLNENGRKSVERTLIELGLLAAPVVESSAVSAYVNR
jgi:dihydrodipicolinate synthase/N-acetylneuraminate lyase